MHTDQEVLAALRAHLDQDQLATVLNRILRVPEAWASLHTPAFLDEVVDSIPSAHLTPSHLASLALGGSLHSEMRRTLAEAHSERARQVWEEATLGVVVQRNLFDAALLGAEFGRRYDGEPEGLLERVADSPTTWHSPLAITWLSLEHPENLLGQLLERNLSNFAIQIALANFPASEVAAYLTRNANGSTVNMLQQITRSGESELARSLSASSSDKLSQSLVEAVARQFNGEYEAAQSSLRRAWEIASETSAQVADFTADQARDSGDPVTELEANRRALEILPTPVRRARTALSLASLDRPGEANSLVSGPDPSVEEQIAGGLAQSQSSDSRDLLNSALASIDNSVDEEWFALLTEGLVRGNDWAAAVQAAQTRVAHHPSSKEAHVSLAQVLLEAGDSEAADEHVAIGLALDPQSAKARNLQTEIQQRELQAYEAVAAVRVEGGEDSESAITLTEAIQADPKDPAARLILSGYLRAQGKVSEALEVAAVAWELDEENVVVGLAYADLLIELGHVDRALEILRRAALREPLSWQVGLALAMAYERRGDMEAAAQAFRALPSSAPPEAYFHSARIALKAGFERPELGSALQNLETAENGGWADPALDYWLGRAFERDERYEEALARYERAQISDDYEMRERAVLGTARAALGLNQISKALAMLEEAQSGFPRSARILASMSDVYLFAKLPDKALEVAERAVELDPEEKRAWNSLGDALANAGDFRGAVKAIERLSALDPEAAEGWLTLARLASQSRDQRVERRSVAEALWRGRRNPKVLQEAAQFLEQTGSLHSAVRVMKAAIRSRPNDPFLLAALARIQESEGDYRGAFETWQARIALSPSEPEPLRRSAACAQNLGLGDQAVKLLGKAVTIEPGNSRLRRDLAVAFLEQGQIRPGLLAYAGAVKTAPNDSSLAYEAAEAALRSGDPRYALALLGKMGSALGESGRAQAAMGEAFLLLDKQERASKSLSEAIEQGYETSRAFSMLAVAAQDFGKAARYLEQARRAPVESAHDAIWLARAEIGLFNGTEAMEALRSWEADPFAAQEQVRIALRMRDTLWLFGLSDAVSPHREESLTSFAEETLKALEKRNLADPFLNAWLRIEEAPAKLGESGDVDAMGWMGEAVALTYIKGDQLEAAREAVDQVRLVRSQAEWGSILEGMIHEASGREESARAAYRSGRSSNPVARFLLGRAYKRSGSLERAATHMGAAVIEAPNQHRWQHKLASVYLEIGDEDSALAHFQEAVAGDAENPEYSLSLAAAYATSGHLNQALEGYTAALAYGSDTGAAYREAAKVALQLGALDQASAWSERAITLSPSNIDSLVGSAMASIARGDEQQANERLEAAIQQAPDDARVLLGVGHVRAGSGDYRAAMSAFEQALKAGADPSVVRHGEGKVLVQQGKHAQAAEVMQEVLNSAPQDHRLWHELAETLEAGADLNGAERAESEAIRISPANPEYRLGLGRISRKSGNLDRAIEELRQAEGAGPEDPRIPIEAGLVYEDRREFSRALDSYLKAVEIDSNSLQAHFRAGVLLRTLKAYRKAGEMLKRATELAPADQEVMHQLAAVRALELVHG